MSNVAAVDFVNRHEVTEKNLLDNLIMEPDRSEEVIEEFEAILCITQKKITFETANARVAEFVADRERSRYMARRAGPLLFQCQEAMLEAYLTLARALKEKRIEAALAIDQCFYVLLQIGSRLMDVGSPITAQDGNLTRRVIRETRERIVGQRE